MIFKLSIAVSIIGFLIVGLLLYTNHAGFAIKIVNYLFLVLFTILIYEKIYK